MASFLKKRNPIDGSAGPATGSANTNLGRMPLPRWMLGLRALQWLLAFLVLSLAAYALHIYRNTGLQGSHITAIIIAVLTILILLPLATAIHFASYHPKLAIAADIIAMLLWLAALAVLASYSHIYSALGNSYSDSTSEFYRAGNNLVDFNARSFAKRQYSSAIGGSNGNIGAADRILRRAWRCGATAAAFSGLEFLLFLLTALLLMHHYHRHRLAQHAPPDYGRGMATTTAPATSYTTTQGPQYGANAGDQHEMQRPGGASPTTAYQYTTNDGAGKDEMPLRGGAGV